MSVLIRTEDEPFGSRLELLRHIAGESLVPYDIRPAVGAADLRVRARISDVGELSVTEAAFPPWEAFRTAKLIRGSDLELCKIDVIVRGQMIVEQDGRQAVLGPGDVAFADLSRAFHAVTTTHVEAVAVMFPRALLPLRGEDLARLTAVRIPGGHGVGALISSLARRIPAHLNEHGTAGGVRVGAAFLDVLSVALAARLDRGDAVPRDSRQHDLLTRIHAFIEERLSDPALSPATIAAAHHISLRYLHKLFESLEATVAGWIRRRRLERCRRDLLDPAMAARPVNAIAANWGLPDPAGFSRAFRNAYGMPPGEYRARADRRRSGRSLDRSLERGLDRGPGSAAAIHE